MQNEYYSNPDFANQLKYLVALAFVPVCDVQSVYSSVIKEGIFADTTLSLADNLSMLLEYFEKTWVGRPNQTTQRGAARYPIPSWNAYEATLDDRSRTNNSVEGWHNGIRSCIRRNINIATLFQFLQKEEALTRLKTQQFQESGRNASQKRSNYTKHDKNIKKIVESYAEYDNKLIYLNAIAAHIKY